MKKFYTVLSVAALFFITQFSCTKIDTTSLGTDLIPAVDNVTTFDTTFDVETDLFSLPDSTAVFSSSSHALGSLNDGVFGTTNAGIYFSISPSNGYIRHPFGDKDSVTNAQIDSVVLQLAYVATYGDSASNINIQVEEINTGSPNLFKDTITGYNINTPKSFFGTGNNILGSKIQNYTAFNDAAKVIHKRSDTVTVTNVLRVTLNRSLGVRLLSYDTTSATSFAYKTDSFFRAQFQGLGIVANSSIPLNSGALAYFNLRDAKSRLIVYYRGKKEVNLTKEDTLESSFVLGVNNFATANVVSRNKQFNYATALANSSTTESEIFLQSSPGSYASVKIPGLQNFTNRTIHRAELIVERVPSTDLVSFNTDYPFGTPPILFLDAVDSSNNNRPTCVPNDLVPSTTTSLGYDILTFGGDETAQKGYRFNLSRYVQGIVTRKEKSYTLRLYAPYNTRPYYNAASAVNSGILNITASSLIGYGRVIVGGGNHPDATKKMRLRIIYSKI